jgi:hypothetical protein
LFSHYVYHKNIKTIFNSSDIAFAKRVWFGIIIVQPITIRPNFSREIHVNIQASCHRSQTIYVIISSARRLSRFTFYRIPIRLIIGPRASRLTLRCQRPWRKPKREVIWLVAWKQWNAEIEQELVLINMADYKEYIGVY